MGSGQKAWAEELEAEAYADKVTKFKSLSQSAQISALEKIKDCLQRFLEDNPSLTRTQFYRIDEALKAVKELI